MLQNYNFKAAIECSNEPSETSADEEQKLPILKIFDDLVNQIQSLKGVATRSFPGSDFVRAFRILCSNPIYKQWRNATGKGSDEESVDGADTGEGTADYEMQMVGDKQAAEDTQQVPVPFEAHVYDTEGVWKLFKVTTQSL
ncbi:hypothetical protein Ancab_011793 [Ancistrocladus abbreviatus]